MKKLLLILFVATCFSIQMYAESLANEVKVKDMTKADWEEVYAVAGCNEMNFLQKEICKTKVFQKASFTESKYQLKDFFEKLKLN